MSDHYQNIDKLFQQGLKDHKVTAPSNTWSRLQNDLHKPAKRGMFWLIRAAAAVILLMVAFGGGYYFSKMNVLNHDQLSTVSNEKPAIVEPENIENTADFPADQTLTPIVDVNQTASSPETFVNNEEQSIKTTISKPSGKNPIRIENHNLSEPAQGEIQLAQQTIILTTDENNSADTPEISTVQEMETTAENSVKDELQAEILNPENIQASENVPVLSDEMLHEMLISGDDVVADDLTNKSISESRSKWSIGGRVSPVYSYRSISGDAFQTPDESVDVDYFNSNENGLTTIAGGISLDFIFNNRLSLGSGMYLSRVGQQNNEVLAYNDPESSSMYKLTSSVGSVSVNPRKFETAIVEQPASDKDTMPGDYMVNGSFVQNLDYLEVPLVLKYKVLDKKFSVNLMGGVSPGILVNNSSYFEVDGEKSQTGTTQNIEPFIYNSIIGIGLEYAINRKLSLNMEPSFKYALSPVNSNNGLNYHPYSLSWFTGISYKID